jgi:hypothetical protein
MSRRDEIRQAYSGIYAQQAAPKSNQKRPEKMCGVCSNYLEAAFTGEGVGTCTILKLGSDILANPPVFVMEGENGYRTMNLRDAAACPHYSKMEFVDKDGTECNDPKYRRSMRQMQDL